MGEKAAEELLDYCRCVNLKTNETVWCGLAALLKLTLQSKNPPWDMFLSMISIGWFEQKKNWFD